MKRFKALAGAEILLAKAAREPDSRSGLPLGAHEAAAPLGFLDLSMHGVQSALLSDPSEEIPVRSTNTSNQPQPKPARSACAGTRTKRQCGVGKPPCTHPSVRITNIPPPATNPHPSTHIHATPLARTRITNSFRQLQSRSATSTYLTLCVGGGLKSFQLTWTGAVAAAAGGGESTTRVHTRVHV